jgi:hypothetical protein
MTVSVASTKRRLRAARADAPGKDSSTLRLQHQRRAQRQIVRSGERRLILEDDWGSSRGDIEIAHAGDDAGAPSWEREQP